jgi:phage terminase large subunit-like protein
MDNATLKVDSRGARLAKDARNSPRKIDLAVAAVMAFDRACAPLTDGPEPFAFFD